jgi:hypothetical protein
LKNKYEREEKDSNEWSDSNSATSESECVFAKMKKNDLNSPKKEEEEDGFGDFEDWKNE